MKPKLVILNNENQQASKLTQEEIDNLNGLYVLMK